MPDTLGMEMVGKSKYSVLVERKLESVLIPIPISDEVLQVTPNGIIILYYFRACT